MFFGRGFNYGFGMGGYDDMFGVDRGDWAEKSQKAEQRERFAKDAFTSFLSRCENETVFPFTEVVVKPSNHLTDACWRDFKKFVISKGCTAKRREVPFPGVKRKSYEIEVTVPAHPSKAVEAAEEKKLKAAQAAAAKKARAEQLAIINAEKARVNAEKAKIDKEKAKVAYEMIIKRKDRDESIGQSNAKRQATESSVMDGSTLVAPLAMLSPEAKVEVEKVAKSSSKKDIKPDAKADAILAHAAQAFQDEQINIARIINAEQSKLMDEVRANMAKKKAGMVAEAKLVLTDVQDYVTATYGKKK